MAESASVVDLGVHKFGGGDYRFKVREREGSKVLCLSFY